MATPGDGRKRTFTAPNYASPLTFTLDPPTGGVSWMSSWPAATAVTTPIAVSVTLDADTIERIAARVVDILADRAASKNASA